MKRLSVIIALALCLTIGGVYAAWTYSVGTPAEQTGSFAVAMGTKVLDDDTNSGSFSVVSTPSFVVEPGNATNYTTTLVKADGSADLVIKFTPNANASADIKSAAVPAQIAIAVSGFGNYNDAAIITVNTANVDLVWVNNGGELTATIPADTFLGYLTLASNVLDTPAKYDTYAAALATGEINITVSAK